MSMELVFIDKTWYVTALLLCGFLKCYGVSFIARLMWCAFNSGPAMLLVEVGVADFGIARCCGRVRTLSHHSDGSAVARACC